jgi:hypothetical protein
MQERAFSLGNEQFQWSVRGEQFRQAIFDVCQQHAALQTPSTPPDAGLYDIDLAAAKRYRAHA